MTNFPALAGLINQTRLNKLFSMFRNGFNIAVQSFTYPFQRDSVLIINYEQNLNSSMISYPFQMSFHLSGRLLLFLKFSFFGQHLFLFYRLSPCKIIPQHSGFLQNVGVSSLGVEMSSFGKEVIGEIGSAFLLFLRNFMTFWLGLFRSFFDVFIIPPKQKPVLSGLVINYIQLLPGFIFSVFSWLVSKRCPQQTFLSFLANLSLKVCSLTLKLACLLLPLFFTSLLFF